VRIRDAVSVASFVDHGLSAYLEQRDARRRIEIGVAAAHQPLLARLADERIEPIVVAEADAHDELGVAQLREVPRARLECFRIGTGRYDRLDGDKVAAYRRDERCEIGGRRQHARGGRKRSGGRQGRRRHDAEEPGPAAHP